MAPAIEGSSGPVQCDGLTNTVSMSGGGRRRARSTSALSASGLPDTAWATYSGDGSFTASGGALYTSDGNFNSSVPTTSDPGPARSHNDHHIDAHNNHHHHDDDGSVSRHGSSRRLHGPGR